MGEFRFWDLLYQRYADPQGLIALYMEKGQFGELVTNLLEAERKRQSEAAKEEEERRLWELYLHSRTEKSFNAWRQELLRMQKRTEVLHRGDADLTRKEAHDILTKLFPTMHSTQQKAGDSLGSL